MPLFVGLRPVVSLNFLRPLDFRVMTRFCCNVQAVVKQAGRCRFDKRIQVATSYLLSVMSSHHVRAALAPGTWGQVSAPRWLTVHWRCCLVKTHAQILPISSVNRDRRKE